MRKDILKSIIALTIVMIGTFILNASVFAIVTPSNPIQGDVKGLTLLVRFPDDPNPDNPNDKIKEFKPSQVSSLLNDIGYNKDGNKGSIRDYFYTASYGKLTYTNIVTPFYYTARQNRSYYTYLSPDEDKGKTGYVGFGQRARELVIEALRYYADRGVDFSTLTKKDNKVWCLNVMFTGGGDGGLGAHSWNLGNPLELNDTIFSNYQITCMNETLVLGVFLHESGHMLCGWDDMRPTSDLGRGYGAGKFDSMALGGIMTEPTLPNPYCSYFISGWGTPEYLNSYTSPTTLTACSNSRNLFIYETADGTDTSEYFVIENKRKGGMGDLPDEGLAIWHIDTDKSVSSNVDQTGGKHYQVSLEQADGQDHLGSGLNDGDANDLFPYGDNTSFSKDTTPNSNLWNGKESGLTISNIGPAGDCISFTYLPKTFMYSQTEVPSSFRAYNRNQNTMMLIWSAPTAYTPDHYNIYADIDTGNAFISGALVGTSQGTSKAITLESNKIYNLYVKAVKATGEKSSPSNTYVVSTDYTAPTAPTSLSASSVTSNSVNLIWNESTDNMEVSGYEVYQVVNGTRTLKYKGASPNCSLIGLTPGTTYNFIVCAYDSYGKSQDSSILSVTTKLSTPTNVIATGNTSSVTLSWNSVTGASAYNVYASVKTNTGSTFWIGYDASGTSLVVDTLSNCIYNFYITAADADGTDKSDRSPACMYSTDVTAPTAPTGLSYSNLTASSVRLSWSASTDTFGIDYYEIYDGTNSISIAKTIKTTFDLTNIDVNESHTFTVKAVDKNGNKSAASNAVTVVNNLEVTCYNSVRTASTNQISECFRLKNTGTSPIDLSKIKLRYYYTTNATNPANQTFNCDYFTLAGGANGKAYVTGNFVYMSTPKDTANYYLEIGFTTGAGSLAVGETKDLQIRFNKNDWSYYTQTDDYSFNSSASSYIDWNKITLYNSGNLAYGIAP